MGASKALSAGWADAIEAWMRDARRTRDWSEQTRRTRRDHLETDGRSIGGSPWDVDDDVLCTWWETRRWSQETRRGHLASHRAFWAWAVAAGHMTESPAIALPKAKASVPRPRPTPVQVVDEAYRAAPARERLMVRLAREVGMRRGEVAQAHTDDLVEDLLGWTLIVHGKGGRERPVPLPADLAAELRSLPLGYFFPGRINGHLSPRWVGTVIARLMPGDWTMHTLRHRFATDAHDVERDLAVVQELLGHANINTTRNYVAVPKPRLRTTVVAVSAAQGRTHERQPVRALR